MNFSRRCEKYVCLVITIKAENLNFLFLRGYKGWTGCTRTMVRKKANGKNNKRENLNTNSKDVTSVFFF